MPNFEKKCLYVPLAPEDSPDPKGPNIKDEWPGPTVKEAGTYSSKGNLWTHKEKNESDWGRWGIAGWNGDRRLLILDFDLYKMSKEQRKEIVDSYNEEAEKTRVHKSLHGGMHLFYLVNPKHLDAKFTDEGEVKAKLPVKLRENIDDKLNGYVVSPECEGYEVQVDRNPAEINPKTDLPDKWLKEVDKKKREHADKLDDEELTARLKKVLEEDEKFSLLWSGKHKEAGFGDRSSAEASLASKIGFWFGRNEETIEKLMEKSASPKWHEREDRSYRDSIVEAGLMGEETYTEPRQDKGNLPYFTEEEKFVPMWLAKGIMDDHHFVTHEESEELFIYEDGIYVNKGETVAKEVAQRKLGSYVTNHYVNETVEAIRRANYTSQWAFGNPEGYIATENGLLDIEEKELKPFSPDYIHLAKVPVEYDPEADCPKIKKFVEEVVGGSNVKLIQEMVGYCLLKRYPLAKAFMLLGSGANGKTTFLKLLERFLGKENVANPSLQELLENRFAKIELFGKLANIHADLSPEKLEQTGTFKMLTGSDSIRGEKKYQNAVKFWNHAKLIFSANELPRTGDRSEAFFRRWIIIEFPNQFPEDDPDTDPNILKKITTEEELSGLLNWALEGLDRLLENGRFSWTESREKIEQKWIRETDSLRSFLDQVCVTKTDAWISKEDFYDVYKGFCDKHGIYVVKKGPVTKRLPTLRPTVDLYRPEINGKRVRCWRNLTLKREAFEEGYVQNVQPLCKTDVQDVQGTYTTPSADARARARKGSEKQSDILDVNGKSQDEVPELDVPNWGTCDECGIKEARYKHPRTERKLCENCWEEMGFG